MSARWLALAALLLGGCDEGTGTTPAPDAEGADAVADAGVADGLPDDGVPDAAVHPLDRVLRLNHVQTRGTHNSYHVEPDPLVAPSHAYTHAPLAEQLEAQGVRQLELDVHYRPGEGFHVFHLPLIDPETTCLRFVDCLGEVAAWSEAHPAHLPLLIWLEPKDEADGPASGYAAIAGHYLELEAEIRSVFGPDHLLTPDDVRGAHETLPEAIRADGWPTLAVSRGRVAFALLDSGEHRDAFVGDDPTLAGRAMFVDADAPEQPFAAMFKINDAERDAEEVRRLVEAGFLVTCNADGAGEAEEDNARRRDASLVAGAHFLGSDHPAPGDGGYWLEIPGGPVARCNPVSAPPECEDAALNPSR